MGSYNFNVIKKSAILVMLLSLFLINLFVLKDDMWCTKGALERILDVNLFCFNILWLCQHMRQLNDQTKEIKIPAKIFIIYKLFLVTICAFCVMSLEIIVVDMEKTESSFTYLLILAFMMVLSIYLFLYSIPNLGEASKQDESYANSDSWLIELFVIVLLMLSLELLVHAIHNKEYALKTLFDFMLVCFNGRWLLRLLVGNKPSIKGVKLQNMKIQFFLIVIQVLCFILLLYILGNRDVGFAFSIYHSFILILLSFVSYLVFNSTSGFIIEWSEQ